MLSSHYAPSIPLYFGEVDDLMQDQDENEVAIINFCEKKNRYARATQWVLSPSMSTQEAAKNLFALLRVLDKQHYKKIIAEPAPNTGLGLAINDRLRRAAFRNW
jgi:L-threonylcarbamoyladenylate synthase